jgi:hypothetical protein
LILPSIALIFLNVILIARLKPQLTHDIRPSTLSMGFFNQLEVSQIQNGVYAKTSTFEQQIIGNLGDVMYNANKVLVYKHCDMACCEYYFHTYLYQIPCTNQSVLFYKDCANASSLTIHVTYLDSGPYPWYNCLVNQANCPVNQANKVCASLCTHLLSSYKLILIQEFKPNQVQPAWTGLSSLDTKINIQLIHDSSLNPCP